MTPSEDLKTEKAELLQLWAKSATPEEFFAETLAADPALVKCFKRYYFRKLHPQQSFFEEVLDAALRLLIIASLGYIAYQVFFGGSVLLYMLLSSGVFGLSSYLFWRKNLQLPAILDSEIERAELHFRLEKDFGGSTQP